MIRLENIIKDYQLDKTNIVHALKGISLSFPETGLVSILGPSGCGKTTLLNILGGLDKYTSGDLIIDGTSTRDFKDVDWDNYRNKKVGMIFQSYNLIPHMKVIDNVELALSLSGVNKNVRKELAIESLKQVGLKNEINKTPNQLSGGQAQRVAIARALINNPSVILADEPTGALDSKTSLQVMEILESISKDKLIIMVTHNRELAFKYSTKIIEMSDGQIVKEIDNSPDNLPNSISNNSNLNQLIDNKLKESSSYNKGKTSMSFFTAMMISLKNMLTKKGRVIMTSFAGSIGIIGVALILAVSNGFSNFINNMQQETLASYPLTIDSIWYDTNAILNSNNDLVEYPDDEQVNIQKSDNFYHVNNLSDDYVEYVNNLNSELTSAIQLNYALQTNIVFEDENNPGSYTYLNNASSSSSILSTSSWNELPDNKEFILSNYDLISGKYPSNSGELILVVDRTNSLSENTLQALGYNTLNSFISFNDIINKTYKLIDNDDFYQKSDEIQVSGRFLKSKEELAKDNLTFNQFYSEFSDMLMNLYSDSSNNSNQDMLDSWQQLIDKYFNSNSETKTISSYLQPNSSDSTLLKSLYESSSKELKVVGILRPRKDTSMSLLSSGLYYTSSLINENLQTSENSNLAKDIENHIVIENISSLLGLTSPLDSYYILPQIYSLIDSSPKVQIDYQNIFSSLISDLNISQQQIQQFQQAIQDNNIIQILSLLNEIYQDNQDILNLDNPDITTSIQTLVQNINSSLSSYVDSRKTYGADKLVNSITIYPKSFEAKKEILTYLDNWNVDKPSSKQVQYTDLAGIAFSAIETTVNLITIVLVCFSSISLIVSCVMIGIIMYSSVLERTKEIGIYRAIGARKKDISRLFKVEGILLGFVSGLIGIIITYILCIPINLIINSLITGVQLNNIASLAWYSALILIAISMLLTFISALIPAKFAANKDPVKALRSSD